MSSWKMAGATDSILEDEVSVLQSIYLPEELEVKGPKERPCQIIVMLHPYTADNEDEKYVCMQLVIKVDEKYPFSKPSFDIKMPRGISENQIDSILLNLDGLASHKLGEEMLFTLIEYAKECLTNNNKPECPCAICLDFFQEDDNFTRTECFHFFHDVCMACHVMSYVESIERKTESSPFEKKEETSLDLIPCPVCRTVLDKRSLKIDGVDTEKYTSEEITFEPSEKFLAWRKRMKAVFQRQQKRGGIIDIEAEKNKFLIETKTKERRKADATADDVKDSDVDERTRVISGIEDWIADGGVITNSGPQTYSKSVSGYKGSSCYGGRSRNVPRKESGGNTDQGRKSNWKSTESRKYNNPLNTGCKDVEKKMVSQIQRTCLTDDLIEVKPCYPNKEQRGVAEKTFSSKSQPRKNVKPPPGFKPLT